MSRSTFDVAAAQGQAAPPERPSWRGHLRIARVDHWIKNVFVLPGILAGATLIPTEQWGGTLDAWTAQVGLAPWAALVLRFVLGMASVCLIASSNYTINEVLDAPFDRKHPTKRLRPVPAGQVSLPWAYVQWMALMAVGLGLGWLVSTWFMASMAMLWLMGCVYNIPPVRSKDQPYLDVLSEAVNNPLRLLAGWFIVSSLSIPPASLLISYWMVGCYFMAIKRYAEMREIDKGTAAAYRASFRHYTPERLMMSIIFYGSTAMLFFGAFTIRYRLEWILAYPLVAWVMAAYLNLSFRRDSAAQAPEKLYREPSILLSTGACAVTMAVLLVVDVPLLYHVFAPTIAGFR